MGRKFGRDYIADGRDYKLTVRVSGRKQRRWRDGNWIGDQEDADCVGYAWAHWLYSAPIRQWINPTGIYRVAKDHDEWIGNDYDGTSVRAGAKVLKMLGAIGEYRFTIHASVAATYILDNGPIVAGTEWREGMSSPDSKGIMSLDGKIEGGHAFCVIGYHRQRRLFLVKNSWGRNWGMNGYAYLRESDFQILLRRDGECCTGTEIKLRPEV